MQIILVFLVKFETWIYVLAAIAAVIFLRSLIISWRELKTSIFGLERENARRKLNSNLSGLVLTGIIVTAEFIMVSVITIKYPSQVILATPTLEIQATETPAIGLIPGIAGTELITPQTGSTVNGCVPGKLEWIFPTAGDTVSGKVELKGTVNVPDLGFYKYEFKAAGDPAWVTIAGGSLPVVEGALGGLWQTENLLPGDYELQLVALDNSNKSLPPCVIPIAIKAP
jgi:hypothetical protein